MKSLLGSTDSRRAQGPDLSSPNYSRPILHCGLAAASLLSIYAVFAKGGLVDLWRIHRNRQEITSRAALLLEQNQRLERYVERLRHDDRLLEQLAREELGWVKEGDLVYRFPAPDKR